MAQKAEELPWDGGAGFERYSCYSDLLGDTPEGDSIQGPLAQVSCEAAATSSSGGSMCEKRAQLGSSKRDFKDFDDADCALIDKAQEESSEDNKHPSTRTCSSKRSRAAEVHNLSEKRRRNRINEKMKALQNLIPNSNKTDKASMLDEAIDYLKKLQLQVQILSARSGIDLSSMCMLSEMQQLQMLQIPKTFSNTGSVGVSLSMDRRTGLVDMTHGPSRSPLLALHDPHPGSLNNMAMLNVSSAIYDDQNCIQASSKMDRLTSPLLPTVPATSQEIHSTIFLQQHQKHLIQENLILPANIA